MTLQEKFPEIIFYTVTEAFQALEWDFIPTEDGAKEIKCCGEYVTMSGWFGTEHINCEKCKKSMQDITGVIVTGNSTAGLIDFSDVDMANEKRRWYIANKG